MYTILKALRHHKTTVAMVALEIALACAIITNALFLIGNRLTLMHMSTGVDDSHLVWATTDRLDLGRKREHEDAVAGLAADLAALRAIPGVESATLTTSLPLGGGYMSIGANTRPGDKSSYVNNIIEVLATTNTVSTLGIKIDQGRDFLPQEYTDYNPFVQGSNLPSSALITRDLAQEMWPGENPLGKPIYMNRAGTKVVHVVGVIGHLLNPVINSYQGIDRGLMLPVKNVTGMPTYVLRVKPDQRAAVSRAVAPALLKIDPARTVSTHIYTDTIHHYFDKDRAMIWLLVVVIGCLLALTALGVVGLSSFWVQQRTKTIGIRRAIGATRGDILRYFLMENFFIVSMGVVTGSLGAVGLNLWLMHHYELDRMPLDWLPVGAAALWGLGLLSVLGPALRATRVPPVVATRSV